MQSAEPEKITELLRAWVSGDESAHDRLIPLVYRELRHVARLHRRRVGASDTLQTTALVHEAY
jgi:ECF sigma factor